LLENLVNRSIYILRETKAQFKNPCVMWSTGKDSTTMLNLCREAFYDEVPFPVLHIDTGWKFKQILEFRDSLAKAWNLNLIVAKHPKAHQLNPTLGTDPETCCATLKTQVLRETIEQHGFDALIVSIRRDEHYMRNIERVSSPRDRQFRWQILRDKQPHENGDAPFESLQPVELWDLLQTDFVDAHHVRRHPLLHWTETDVWKYIESRGVPVNHLYFSRNGLRYRSLGCRTCTQPVESNASTVNQIIREVETTQLPERSGRQDQLKKMMMRKLRAFGYF